MPQAEDIIKRTYTHMQVNDPLSKALAKFENTDTIIITDDQGNYQGMLAKKDIMKSKLAHHTKVQTLIRNVAKIEHTESVQEIARKMLESNVYELPIVDHQNKVRGTVTAERLLNKVSKGPYGKIPINTLMTTDVTTIKPDESIGKAIKIFKENRISRLPVVKKGKLIGLLTMDDIINKVLHPEQKPKGWGQHGEYIAEKKEYLKIPVEGIKSDILTMMPPDALIKDVIKKMKTYGYRGMLLGTNRQIKGLVTKKDLLEPLAVEGTPAPIVVQFAGDLHDIVDFDKQTYINDLTQTFEKYIDYLDNAQVFVRLKQHDEKMKGMHLIYCKMRISTPRGMFIASDEGWGSEQAINNAKEAIERQINKKKPR